MSAKDYVCGVIKLKRPGVKRSLRSFNYKLPKSQISLDQTLMKEFCHLELSSYEKMGLKREYRKDLAWLKNLDEHSVQESLLAFEKLLNAHQGSPIIIESNFAGTFLCLAAIFRGALPIQEDWHFELNECPISLFPKAFIKETRAALNYQITFRYSNNGWIRSFRGLRKTPSYITLPEGNLDYLQSHPWRKNAA